MTQMTALVRSPVTLVCLNAKNVSLLLLDLSK